MMKKILSILLVFAVLFSFSVQSFGASDTKAYSDKKLGWSINLVSEVNKNTTDTKANEANFKDKDGKLGISVYMYSKAGLTLDSWVNRELSEIKTNYNSNYIKLIKSETGKVNKVSVKKIYIKILLGGKWYTQCSMYLVGKNYRYVVSYSMPSADFDAAAKKARMEGALSSFKFVEPNTAAVGTLNEDSNVIDSAKRVKLESKDYGWALEIPDTWKKVLDLGTLYMYQVNNYEMYIMMQADKNADNKSLEACADEYAAEMGKDKTTKIASRKSTKLNGYDCIAFTITNDGYKVRSYVIAANENIYKLSVYTADCVDIPKNVGAADKIINSLKLTDTSVSIEGNSIKDYAALLKGSTKDKIGDSYYKWSFTAPKKLTVKNRAFNGETTSFVTDDENFFLMVMTFKNEKNETLDTISARMVNDTKNGYSIITSEKRTRGSQEYYVLVYKGDKDKFVNEHRLFIVGDRCYLVSMSSSEEDHNNKVYFSTIDSFDPSFISDGKTEDLSDVNKDGYRTYKSRKLKFSMDTLPEWSEIKADNKDNNISFEINENSFTYVEMYSLESGLTLDGWVKNETDHMTKVFNKQLVQVSAAEDVVINGLKCKRINSTYKTNFGLFHDSYFYVTGKNYRYEFGYSIDDKTYTDAAALAKIEQVIKSFKFAEPDAKLVGKLVDPETLNQTGATRTITSTDYNWSVKLPVTFMADEDSNDDDYASYTCNTDYISFELYAEQAEGTLDEYMAGFNQDVQSHPTKYTVYNTETLNDKGTVVKKITYKYADSNKVNAYNYIEYILVKNGYVYHIYLDVRDIRYSDYSIGVMKSIWDSMTF